MEKSEYVYLVTDNVTDAVVFASLDQDKCFDYALDDEGLRVIRMPLS